MRSCPTAVIAERSRELKRQMGLKCYLCNRRKPLPKLEWAHTQPTGLCSRGRGARGRYYDLLNNPDCYILACRHCHTRLDSSPAQRRVMLTAEKVQRFLLTFEVAKRIVCESSARRAKPKEEGAAA